MNKIWLIFILSTVYISCISSRKMTSNSDHKVYYQPVQSDSLSITVKSDNLSEDMTHNDELLIMGYLYKDSGVLDSVILTKRLTLNPKNMSKTFKWHVGQSVLGKDIMLFIIEQDSDTPSEQIDAILRIHYSSIIKAFKNRSYSEIEKYIGDEDVLDYRLLKDLSTPLEFTFRGIYKMDKYEYAVKIE